MFGIFLHNSFEVEIIDVYVTITLFIWTLFDGSQCLELWECIALLHVVLPRVAQMRKPGSCTGHLIYQKRKFDLCGWLLFMWCFILKIKIMTFHSHFCVPFQTNLL